MGRGFKSWCKPATHANASGGCSWLAAPWLHGCSTGSVLVCSLMGCVRSAPAEALQLPSSSSPCSQGTPVNHFCIS